MNYRLVDLANQSMQGLASVLNVAHKAASSEKNPQTKFRLGRLHSAVLEVSVRMLQEYPKREWDYDDVEFEGKFYSVNESVVLEKPFCKLTHFKRDGLPEGSPKVLFVAALSGHHATLSRETLTAFLPDHEVYVTDWTDARYVPVEEGRFGFEEYMAYVIGFLEHIGPDVHLIGLCQAGVPSLAAVAVMTKNKSKSRPKSMTFMASPMDTRVNPGMVANVAKYISPQLLSNVALHRVPSRFPGAGRLVYPGAVQLSSFMSLSPKAHLKSHAKFVRDVYHGNHAAADKHREFYDEYFSILDSAAEFYLETLERVFLDQKLAKGTLTYQGEIVDCRLITDVPLLSMEGAEDNMVLVGQCQAANDICGGLPSELKEIYVQEGVGHYGIFNGSTFEKVVAPKVKEFIAKYN